MPDISVRERTENSCQNGSCKNRNVGLFSFDSQALAQIGTVVVFLRISRVENKTLHLLLTSAGGRKRIFSPVFMRSVTFDALGRARSYPFRAFRPIKILWATKTEKVANFLEHEFAPLTAEYDGWMKCERKKNEMKKVRT